MTKSKSQVGFRPSDFNVANKALNLEKSEDKKKVEQDSKDDI